MPSGVYQRKPRAKVERDAPLPACSIPGCERPTNKRSGYCLKHYMRWWRYGTTDTVATMADGSGTCRQCGAGCKASRSFCSTRCAARNSRKRVEEVRACLTCGSTIGAHERKDKIFCTQQCANDIRWLEGIHEETFSRKEIFDRDGWVCQLCNEPVGKGYSYPHARCATIDHIKPIARGGKHTRANCQLAHFSCNCSKGARFEDLKHHGMKATFDTSGQYLLLF